VAEAVVDLTRLAGLGPAAILGEILSRDALGMACSVDLDTLATMHGLVRVRVTDVMHYRRRQECGARRFAESKLPTEFGDFRCVVYESTLAPETYVALVMGDVSDLGGAVVGFHVESLIGDALGGPMADGHSRVQALMGAVARNGCGVLLYRRSKDFGSDWLVGSRNHPDPDTAAEILVDLGVREARLLPGSDFCASALQDYGVRIAGWIGDGDPAFFGPTEMLGQGGTRAHIR
jgi:3,4-dihydroxy 2-butanone 4-phosphate synthase/GTP cyclohydrolase II